MNLITEFDNGLEKEEFELLLGENKIIHDLHYKKFSPDSDMTETIKKQSGLKIIVLTEPWCGDSLASVPVLLRISEIHGGWDIRFLLRDENAELMDRFLTKGGRAIPVFIFLDKSGELTGTWGPRPDKAREIFESHRDQIESGDIDRKEVYLKLRKFYASDRGIDIMNTIIKVLKNS
ncbi:MAG: thioredoxin family protein [Acidobacteriota bacterium]